MIAPGCFWIGVVILAGTLGLMGWILWRARESARP